MTVRDMSGPFLQQQLRLQMRVRRDAWHGPALRFVSSSSRGSLR